MKLFAGSAFFEFFDTVSDTGLTPDKLYLFILVTAGAFIAFAMEISEFLLLSYTSSLTLSIAGIFKVMHSQNTICRVQWKLNRIFSSSLISFTGNFPVDFGS